LRITATVFDTSDVEESGRSEHELKKGVRVRKYKIRRGYTEKGVEVSAEVADERECARLLEKLFNIAGIQMKKEKAARV
jgi:hypothetical protein